MRRRKLLRVVADPADRMIRESTKKLGEPIVTYIGGELMAQVRDARFQGSFTARHEGQRSSMFPKGTPSCVPNARRTLHLPQ